MERNITSEYRKKKKEIINRLSEFAKMAGKNRDRLFSELCFCLLTPQSKAVNCEKAVSELKKQNLLKKGSDSKIAAVLRRLVRFHNKKAGYIICARRILKKNGPVFCGTVDAVSLRERLVKDIKGLGYKEASHFLRNIGLGEDIAIIDRHVITNLKKEKIIRKVPDAVTKKNYLEIEEKMREFSSKKKIPLAALDLLFWSRETGFIFK